MSFLAHCWCDLICTSDSHNKRAFLHWTWSEQDYTSLLFNHEKHYSDINMPQMKMAEHSRTSRISQIVQSIWPKVLFVMDWETHTNSLCDVMTSYHDVMRRQTVMSHEVTPLAMISHGNSLQAKTRKSHFLTWWPWPLIYDLDLLSQPS